MTALLRIEDVSVAFGRTMVLRNATASLAGGTLTGLIGANGAGKTSLLLAMANLVRPVQGEVWLEERPACRWKAGAWARRVGYLAQGAISHWPLTVERIVALGRLPHLTGWRGPGEPDRLEIDRAMQEVDVQHLRDRPMNTLSGGERARVMLARVLAGQPRVLLADEPVAGLDPAHQLQVMTSFSRLAKGGRCVLVVIHDLTLAARFCDRLIVLKDGRIVAQGPTVDTLTADLTASAFAVRCFDGGHDGPSIIIPWEPL